MRAAEPRAHHRRGIAAHTVIMALRGQFFPDPTEETVRNYGASLGFAILGTILITELRSRITSSLTAKGLPGPAASAEAAKIAQLQGESGNVAFIPQFIRADFAGATREVLYGMCVVMAVAGFVALRGLRRGVQQEAAGQLAGEAPDADLYPAPR